MPNQHIISEISAFHGTRGKNYQAGTFPYSAVDDKLIKDTVKVASFMLTGGKNIPVLNRSS
jgi:hypothetical protein